MKKGYFLVLILFLSGCIGHPTFSPYDTKEVSIGQGAFMEKSYKLDVDGKDNIVEITYYIGGLPKNKECKLLGLLTFENERNGTIQAYKYDLINREVIKNKGNTITRENKYSNNFLVFDCI